METPVVWLAALSVAACASPAANRNPTPDPNAAPDLSSQCYAVMPAATPKAPVSSWRRLGPGLIELGLGGGFTGYVFTLRQGIEGGWVAHSEPSELSLNGTGI